MSDIRLAVDQALAEQRNEFDSDFRSQNSALAALVEHPMQEAVVSVARDLLRSRDPQHRILAARILREVPSKLAHGAVLLELAKQEEDRQVLIWVVAALIYVGDASAVPLLSRLARHESAEVRDRVAGAISQCAIEQRDPVALEVLDSLSVDPDVEVRFSATWELSEWWRRGKGEERLEAALRARLEDAEERIRTIAAEVLASQEADEQP